MKKYIILLVVFFSVALSGCYKEDPIVVEKDKYWRDYDVNSKDPAFKYVSEYFAKYDKVFLYDAQVRDYVYNFQAKNKIKITNPTTNIHEKLKLLDKLFLSKLSDKLMHDLTPFNVIIAEEIEYTGGTGTPSKKETAVSTNYWAFKVTDASLALSETDQKKLSITWVKMFVLDYCIGLGKISLNPKFYEFSAAWYSKRDPNTTSLMGIEKAYEKGLLYIDSRYNEYQEKYLTDYRSKDGDPLDYLNMLLTWPEAEITALRAKYSLIDQKAAIYIKMLESLGIDYRTLK